MPIYELESGGGRRVKRSDLDGLLRPAGEVGEAVVEGRSHPAVLLRRFPADKMVDVRLVGRITFDPTAEIPPSVEHRIIAETDFNGTHSAPVFDPRLPDVVEDALKAAEGQGHDMDELPGSPGPSYAAYRCKLCTRELAIQPVGNRLGRTVQDAILFACKEAEVAPAHMDDFALDQFLTKRTGPFALNRQPTLFARALARARLAPILEDDERLVFDCHGV